jgi:predicted nucleic acid-binding protein
MEVMVGTSPETEPATRAFLSTFDVLDIEQQVAERSVQLRRKLRIRLPDAIIWATAQVHAMLLITRNTKDFPQNDPGVRVPYAL